MSESLIHSGIKGQKWGIRRFQNEDGSLTAEGRQRYGYGEEKNKQSVNKTDKQQRNKKIAKIAVGVAATAAVAAAGFLAYKKATKLRDVMRSNAKTEAEKHFWESIKDGHYYRRDRDNALDARYNRDRASKLGDAKKAFAENSKLRSSMKSAAEAHKRMTDNEKAYKAYKKISESATRRDAVREYIRERGLKSQSKKAKKVSIINARNTVLRNRYPGNSMHYDIKGRIRYK